MPIVPTRVDVDEGLVFSSIMVHELTAHILKSEIASSTWFLGFLFTMFHTGIRMGYIIFRSPFEFVPKTAVVVTIPLPLLVIVRDSKW